MKTVKFRICLDVILCGSFFMFIFFQMNMFNTLLLPLQKNLHLTLLEISYLSAALYMANLVFLLVSGQILDRYSPKWVMGAMFMFASISAITFALVSNFWALFMTRFFVGIAGAFCFIGPIKYMSLRFSKDKLAFIISLFGLMAFFAGFLAQKEFYNLIAAIGWRQAIISIGCLGILASLVFMLFLNEANNIVIFKHHNKWHIKDFFGKLFMLLRNKITVLCATYDAIMNFSIGIFGALWGNFYLQKAHHFSASQAASISGMLFIGHLCSVNVIAWLGDHYFDRQKLMVIAPVLAALACVVLGASSQLSAFVAGCLFFIIGISSAIQPVVYAHVVANNPKDFTATSISLVSLFLMGSIGLTQPAIGYLIKLNYDFSSIIYLINAFYFCAIIISFFVNTKQAYNVRQ